MLLSTTSPPPPALANLAGRDMPIVALGRRASQVNYGAMKRALMTAHSARMRVVGENHHGVINKKCGEAPTGSRPSPERLPKRR
jgi:hypothetical protein